jgi:hypothetical protein
LQDFVNGANQLVDFFLYVCKSRSSVFPARQINFYTQSFESHEKRLVLVAI